LYNTVNALLSDTAAQARGIPELDSRRGESEKKRKKKGERLDKNVR